MLKLLIRILSINGLIIIMLSPTAYAGSGTMNINWSCSQKTVGMQFMGQMPLHFIGTFHCIERGSIMGEKVTSASSCVYNGIMNPSTQKMSFAATCRSYHDKENALFMRVTDSFKPMDKKGIGKVTVMGGTGKYKGASGSGTMNWNAGPDDPNDPSIGSNWGKTSVKLTLP